MTQNGTTKHRLDRLESKIRPLRGCDDCINLVGTVRLITTDAEGRLLWENRPEFCQTCGTNLAPDPPFTRELCLVGVDLSEL